MGDDRQTIHIRIRDLRRERSLTQEELAEALGLSRQSINAMEGGRCLPSLPVALQIASYFAVPLSNIFGLEEQNIGYLNQTPNQPQEVAMSNLMPWSPLREMREALDELMDESVSWSAHPQMSGPAVNVSQNEHEVIVELRLPGFKKEDLAIEVGEDFLSVSGERKQEQEEDGRHYFRREFAHQSFQRTISLPALVQTDKAEAEMRHGVLSVKIAKVVEEKPKTARIEIKSGE